MARPRARGAAVGATAAAVARARAGPTATHTQRYRLTAEGLCIALAYHRTQARVLGPVLSATLDGESTTRLHEAVATYDRELGHLWEGQPLAA